MNQTAMQLRLAVEALSSLRTRLEGLENDRDTLIRTLHAQGWTLRKIAAEAGVSFARVAQIINQGEKT